MAAPLRSDVHNLFFVTNSAAVDIASHAAGTSVNTVLDVEAGDLEDQAPLNATQDRVVSVILPLTIEASIAVQTATIVDGNTITLRTTNASAGIVDPASIAANAILFLIARR